MSPRIMIAIFTIPGIGLSLLCHPPSPLRALPQSVLSLIVCPALDEEFCEPSYPVRLAQDEERAGSVAAAAGSALVGHGPVSLAAAAANSHA